MSIKAKWKWPKVALFDNEEAMKVMEKATHQFVSRALSIYQTNIILEAPVGATSQLRNSVMQEQTSAFSGSVLVTAPYAVVIEKGRRPAPVAESADPSLRAWITRSAGGRAFFNGLKAKYPKITVTQAIYILKRSKKKKRTKPNKFFARGVKKSKRPVKVAYKAYSKSLAKGLFT